MAVRHRSKARMCSEWKSSFCIDGFMAAKMPNLGNGRHMASCEGLERSVTTA